MRGACFSPDNSLADLQLSPPVCFSWPNTQLLKRDPIARTWFKSHCTIATLPAALGGWPLTLYEAVASSTQSVPELFLSQQQCDTLLNSLAELMGPSRARASWRDSAWHKREALIRSSAQAGGIKVHVFHSQAELEARFAELKDGDDWAATKTHWRELKRAQEVFQWLGSGATKRPALGEPKFVAVDIETWEQDHALVTEVGVASLRYLQSGKMVTEARHLGAFARFSRLLLRVLMPCFQQSFKRTRTSGTGVTVPTRATTSSSVRRSPFLANE